MTLLTARSMKCDWRKTSIELHSRRKSRFKTGEQRIELIGERQRVGAGRFLDGDDDGGYACLGSLATFHRRAETNIGNLSDPQRYSVVEANDRIRDVPDTRDPALLSYGYLEVPDGRQYAAAVGTVRSTGGLDDIGDGQSVHSKLFLIDIDLIFRQLTADGDDLSDPWNRQYLVAQIEFRE